MTLLAFQVGGRLLSFLTVPLLVRGLGPDMFGAFSTANAIVSMAGIVAGLGLDSLVTREIAKFPQRGLALLFESTVARVITAVITVGVVLPTSRLLGISPESQLALGILSLTLLSSALLGPAASFYFGHEKMARGSLFGIAVSAANLSLVLCAFTLKAGIAGFAAAYAAGGVLVALVSAASLWSRYFRGSAWSVCWGNLLALVGESSPFLALSLALIVYYKIDVVMLAALAGDSSVGVYAAGYRILDVLMFLPAALMGALFPALSRVSESRRADLPLMMERAVRRLALVGIPAAAGVSVVAPSLLQLLYGDGWGESAHNLQILIWSWGLIFLNATCPVALNAIGRPAVNLVVVGVGIASNVSMNLVLVPRWGTIGASWATTLTELLITIVYFVAAMKVIGRFAVARSLLHPVLGSAVMYALLSWALNFLSGPWNLLFLPPVGAAVYGAYVVVVGAVSKSELLALCRAARVQIKGTPVTP